MVEVVWVEIHCLRCHGVVEVQFAIWRPDGPREEGAIWTCPHCGAENPLGVAGQLSVITRPADPNVAVNQW